jgi:hypothetical protein
MRWDRDLGGRVAERERGEGTSMRMRAASGAVLPIILDLTAHVKVLP